MPLQTAPKSAKHGRAFWNADWVHDVSNIRPSAQADIKEYGSSDTAGHVRRIVGHLDRAGTFEAFADQTPFEVGDRGWLRLMSDEEQVLLDDLVKIEDLSYTVNVQTGEIISVNVSYGRDRSPKETALLATEDGNPIAAEHGAILIAE